MTLIKVSLPLSKFKLMLILAMILCCAICYFTPLGRVIFSLSVLNLKHWILVLTLILISYPLSSLVRLGFNKIKGKK